MTITRLTPRLVFDSAGKVRMVWTETEQSGWEAFYTARRGDTGTTVSFGVGASGTSHGVWSNSLGKWLLHGNAAGDVFVDNSNVHDAGILTQGTLAKEREFSLYQLLTRNATYTTAGNVSLYVRGKVGFIQLNGVKTTAYTGRQAIATIPSGYRPAVESYGHMNIRFSSPDFFIAHPGGEVRLDGNGTVMTLWGMLSYPIA